MAGDVELLSQGTEPRRSPRQLSRVARAWAGAGLCLVLVAAGALWWHGSSTRAAAAAAARTAVRNAALTFTPAPHQLVPLAPRVQQVRISTTDQRAYVTSRGHVALDLQLVNDGDLPLSLLTARLPQAGVRSDPGPGGLVSSPTVTLLTPGTPTAVTLHLVVLCPQGLAGTAVNHLDLTLDDHLGYPRSVSLDLRALPGFWDHIRHSACAATANSAATVPLVVNAVPTSVRWEGGTTNG
jgi:hypothetical protein